MKSSCAMGVNAGTGNRAVVKHIKNLHAAAGHSGNSVSSMIAPAKTLVYVQHSSTAQGKQGKPTAKPLD